MAQVRLLSIKRNPEHSYFYENEGATFDSNSNKVTGATGNEDKEISEKSREASEEKEKMPKKDLKHCEKEMSQKKDSTRRETDKNKQTNGNVNNTQFSNAAFEENVEVETEDEKIRQEVSQEITTLNSGSQGGPSTNMNNIVEETITAQGANQSEEAPPELSRHFKPSPGITEMEQGEFVEVEISEVTELDDMSEEVNGHAAVVGDASGPESPIVAATVQEVESGVDLENFFIEVYGESGLDGTEEKRRKSVRFQDPEATEKDSDSQTEVADKPDEDEEKITENNDHPVRLQPTEEIISKEHTSNVESCEVNWDEIFELCEKEGPDNSNAPQGEVVNHREDVVSNDIAPYEKHNEQHDDKERRKEKRKKGGLLKWCFS